MTSIRCEVLQQNIYFIRFFTTNINSNTNWHLTCSFIKMRKRTNQMHFSRKIQIRMHFSRKRQIWMDYQEKDKFKCIFQLQLRLQLQLHAYRDLWKCSSVQITGSVQRKSGVPFTCCWCLHWLIKGNVPKYQGANQTSLSLCTKCLRRSVDSSYLLLMRSFRFLWS